jgi:diguanylate cyclase (GGDEF)-like protein
MDTRARLGAGMALVGEVVLIAFASSILPNDKSPLFIALILLVTFSYLIIVGLSRWWHVHGNKSDVFVQFQRIYCAVQFILGFSWGGAIVSALPTANSVQIGQIYAILIGLVSTAMISGPAIYSVLFWTPIVLLSVAALLSPQMDTNIATAVGIIFYYVLSFYSIISLNRKMIEREISAIKIETDKNRIEVLLRDFSGSVKDWIWEVDENFIIQNASEEFNSVIGCSDPVIPIKFIDLVTEGESDYLCQEAGISRKQLSEIFLRKEPFMGVNIVVCIEGEPRVWELTAKPVINKKGQFAGYLGVSRDITVVQQSRSKINYLAMHDSLTGLLNRESFTTYIHDKMKSAESGIYLFCIDLDYFKNVNDSFGHKVGDILLRLVSARIKHAIKEVDKTFRLGGDEFSIVFTHVDDCDISEIAERILQGLSSPFIINDLQILIGASIGIAKFEHDGISPDELHHRADVALYMAKNGGRNSYRVFDKNANDQSVKLLLSNPVTNQNGLRDSFFLEYQPIIDINSGVILGLEALLRYYNQDGLRIEPNVFIPIIEREGRIIDIGRFVIEEAVKSISSVGSVLRVAVNISPLQLDDGALPSKITHILTRFGVSPDRLEIEVTESSILEDDLKKRDTLNKIQELGCKIVLDDFGTGYSSLRLLDNIRFDKLKIDKSLLPDSGKQDDIRRSHILRTIIELGKRLEIPVVVEGIETIEQLTLVRSMGVIEGQGYYLCKPMSYIRFMEYYNAQAEYLKYDSE